MLEKMSVDGLFEGRLVHVCITENYPNRQILSFSHVRSGAVILFLWSGVHYGPDWSIVIQTETQAETQNRSEVQDVKSTKTTKLTRANQRANLADHHRPRLGEVKSSRIGTPRPPPPSTLSTTASPSHTPTPTMASKLAPWAFRSSARVLRTASRQQQRQFRVSAAPRSDSLNVVCPLPRPAHPHTLPQLSNRALAAPRHTREQPQHPLQVQRPE